MADNERSWWDTATGALGCAAGSVSIAVTAPATGVSCAAAPTGVGALGCAGGAVLLAYEIDQTQASCRQMITGQAVQTVGNAVLGGGYLGLGYDLAGLAGVIKNGGPKLAGMIAQAKSANKLGDLATAARESGEMTSFLKGCSKEDIAKLLKDGKISPKEIEAAGLKIPAGAQGGNVSKNVVAASDEAAAAAKAAKAKAAAEKLGKLKDVDSPEAKALIKEIAENSTHGPADGPLVLGKYPDYINAAQNGGQWYETAPGVYDAMKGNPDAVWAVNEQVLKNAQASGVPITIHGIDDPAKLVAQYAAEGKDFYSSQLAKEIKWLSQNIPGPSTPAAGAWAADSLSTDSVDH